MRRFAVQRLSDVVSRDNARHANYAKIGIDKDFGKYSAEGMHRIFLLFLARLAFGPCLDRLSAAARNDRSHRVPPRRVGAHVEPAVGCLNVFLACFEERRSSVDY